jgi:hypothetical protein
VKLLLTILLSADPLTNGGKNVARITMKFVPATTLSRSIRSDFRYYKIAMRTVDLITIRNLNILIVAGLTTPFPRIIWKSPPSNIRYPAPDHMMHGEGQKRNRGVQR